MITKDENKAVKEVKVVLEVLKEYFESKSDVPYAVLNEVFKKLLAVVNDKIRMYKKWNLKMYKIIQN